VACPSAALPRKGFWGLPGRETLGAEELPLVDWENRLGEAHKIRMKQKTAGAKTLNEHCILDRGIVPPGKPLQNGGTSFPFYSITRKIRFLDGSLRCK